MWHKYPYTNFHDLNLDWILDTIKELQAFTQKVSDKVDEAYKYMKDNLYDNAVTIINQYLEDGTLFVAVTYNEENEELTIITSREGE